MTMAEPLITIAVPSFNQGQYLDAALASIFAQQLPVEVFVLDGGSTDATLSVIHKWEPQLAGWRSHPDEGQSAAINEGLAQGKAPFVCWLNSDDLYEPEGLQVLLATLQANDKAPAAYGKAWNLDDRTGSRTPVKVEPFSVSRLATHCIISQPATLMRRTVWEEVRGLDESLHMAMDYDLWWRIFNRFGPLAFVDEYVATNREHLDTKTRNNRRLHYREAMSVVHRHHGRLPLKWWIAQPYSVYFRACTQWLARHRKNA